MTQKPGNPENYHGTTTGYDYGCRESCCRAAMAEYHLQRCKRLKKIGPPAKLHGTTNAYSNYGCRCPLCSAANTQRKREIRQAKKTL